MHDSTVAVDDARIQYISLSIFVLDSITIIYTLVFPFLPVLYSGLVSGVFFSRCCLHSY